MQIIKWDQTITDFYGKPIKHDGEEVTLKAVVLQCLEHQGTDDIWHGAAKYKYGRLAEKVAKDEQNWTKDEIQTIKNRIGHVMSVMFIYKCWNMLDDAFGN